MQESIFIGANLIEGVNIFEGYCITAPISFSRLSLLYNFTFETCQLL